jgi:hypothetical protein
LLTLPFPHKWTGQPGWKTGQNDFEGLCQIAEPVIREIFHKGLLSLARSRCDVITIGVDLSGTGLDKPHAELVVVFDLKNDQMVWTGKSYPVKAQEKNLVHAPSIRSHFWKGIGERILVLGCHDLTAFSNRARPKPGTPRFLRQQEMRKAAKTFRPTMVLHHPHSTDTVRIWPVAWSGVKEHLWESTLGHRTCASGIAWYKENDFPRGDLSRVLETTRWGDVIDIVVDR